MSESAAKGLRTILSMTVLCAAIAYARENPKPQPVSGKIDWVYNYEEGKKLSHETGKPMFVVFRCER